MENRAAKDRWGKAVCGALGQNRPINLYKSVETEMENDLEALVLQMLGMDFGDIYFVMNAFFSSDAIRYCFLFFLSSQYVY